MGISSIYMSVSRYGGLLRMGLSIRTLDPYLRPCLHGFGELVSCVVAGFDWAAATTKNEFRTEKVAKMTVDDGILVLRGRQSLPETDGRDAVLIICRLK